MDNITRVSIVRHGETEWNLEDKMQGVLDSPLTPKGIALAKELGEKLSGFKFSRIYTS
ncbi:MAG: histidine phosphatase family protein, partial [Spirochaetia bacterium]|nr:histidine phosphatase family protein [Spirochaetia bacterium]